MSIINGALVWAVLSTLLAQPPSSSTASTDAVPTVAVSAAAADPAAPRALFAKSNLGLEAGGAFLTEAWNLNDGREWLADAHLGVFWGFHRRASLNVEFHAIRVFQSPSRDAIVNGFLPMVRWRIVARERRTWFVEAGPGISWSDTVTPPRGTRFNYLLVGGTGVSHRISKQTHAIVGARLLHISNKGREGRARNPDIEGLGGYAAIAVVF
jgi:hypothetical protein